MYILVMINLLLIYYKVIDVNILSILNIKKKKKNVNIRTYSHLKSLSIIISYYNLINIIQLSF